MSDNAGGSHKGQKIMSRMVQADKKDVVKINTTKHLQVEKLQQQKTTLGSSPKSQKHKFGDTMGTDSSKQFNRLKTKPQFFFLFPVSPLWMNLCS